MRFRLNRFPNLLTKIRKLRAENRRLRARLRDATIAGELAAVYHEERSKLTERIAGLEKLFSEPGRVDRLTGLCSHASFGEQYEALCERRAGQEDGASDCLILYHLHGFRYKPATTRTPYELDNRTIVRFVGILVHVWGIDESIVCRQNANRFIIVRPNTSRETAVELAERVKYSLDVLGKASRRPMDLHASCSLSCFRAGTDSFASVFDETRLLLDRSSRDGGNRIMQAA